jgi:putative Holliday junction resolvase
VRSGRRLAVDVGKVRVGLALSDFHGILASPLQNVARQAEDADTVRLILEAVSDEDILEIYVGLPVSIGGSATASTDDAIAIAQQLATIASMPIRMIDERLTTVSATAALRSSGKNSKDGRKVIDQVAATMILEQALAIEKNTEREPGIALGDLDV